MGVFGARSADIPFVVAGSSDYVRFVRIAASLAFLAAVLILLGWACDLTVLKSGFAAQRATQPWSAVCFALLAIALGMSTERYVLCRLFARGAALAVLAFALVTIWQNALDVDWGLDRLWFTDAVVHEQSGPFLRPGRPAAGTLVALGLLSGCLLLTRARSRPACSLYVWLSTAASLLAATVVLAYAYSLQALYTVGFYAHVGLNSGIALAVLAYGILLRRPDLGWMRLLAGASVGAASARRLLLWTGSLLVVLAGIVRLGTSAELYGAGFEVTLLTLGGLGVLLAALLAHARRLDALDTLRNNVSSDLKAAETRLVSATLAKDEHLALLAHQLRNPLTPLRNGVEIIRQMSTHDPILTKTADMMGRQIVLLVRLVDELVGGGVDVGSTAAAPGGMPAGDFLADRLAASPAFGTQRLKILVADDNADGADSLAMLLQAQGHVALTAPDGRRAVELAEVFRPDVILMDVAMPHLDGLAATREIRGRPWGKDVRIIALTAWGQATQRRRTREAGMDQHLVKPVEPQALAAVLRGEPPEA